MQMISFSKVLLWLYGLSQLDICVSKRVYIKMTDLSRYFLNIFKDLSG